MFFSQLEKADSLKNLLELYRQDVTQRGQSKDYDRLLQMVKCHLEERRRKKNRDEYSQGGRQRSLSPVGDKTKGIWKHKGKGKGKGKSKGKGKQKPTKRQKNALVAEAKAALTSMIQTSAQVRQKEKGKEKRKKGNSPPPSPRGRSTSQERKK